MKLIIESNSNGDIRTVAHVNCGGVDLLKLLAALGQLQHTLATEALRLAGYDDGGTEIKVIRLPAQSNDKENASPDVAG